MGQPTSDLSGAHCLNWARCGSKRGSPERSGGSTHTYTGEGVAMYPEPLIYSIRLLDD